MDETCVLIHRTLGPWKEQALSVRPRDPTACQTHQYTCPVHSGATYEMRLHVNMWTLSNYLQHEIKPFWRHKRRALATYSCAQLCVFYKTSIICSWSCLIFFNFFPAGFRIEWNMRTMFKETTTKLRAAPGLIKKKRRRKIAANCEQDPYWFIHILINK